MRALTFAKQLHHAMFLCIRFVKYQNSTECNVIIISLVTIV